MPIFELEANGKSFEVDAPSMDHAIAAIRGTGNAPAPLSQFLTAGPGVGAEIAKDFNAGWGAFKRPLTEEQLKAGVFGGLMNTGKAILAPFQMAASPFTGAARSILGRGLTAATHAAGTIINPEVAARDNPQQMYEQIAPQVDLALSAAAPARGGLPTLKNPTLPPQELSKVPVPTSQELRTSGGQKIEAAGKAAAGDFGPDIMQALSQDTRQVLNPKRERIAPQTFGLVDDLAKDATVVDIQTTRELLGELRMGADPKERRAAKIAIDKIDEFLARNEPLAAGILKEGQANYAAGRRLQSLEQMDRVAGLRTGRAGYGGNEINARRQLASPIVEKYIKGNTQGFSADEMAGLEQFVTGTKGVNALRLMSQLAPSKGGWNGGGGILPIATAGGSLAVGSGSLKIAALLTRNQFQQIMDKVAKRSPAYIDAVNAATDRYIAAANDFSSQPTPAKVAGVVSAARALSNGLKFDGVNITSGELLRRLSAPVQSAAEDQQPVPGRPGQ